MKKTHKFSSNQTKLLVYKSCYWNFKMKKKNFNLK